MASLPPWHFLKSKSKESKEADDLHASGEWHAPTELHLDKNVKFYRDLVKSTEKVELTLSHSGKKEVFESYDDPQEPSKRPIEGPAKDFVVNVTVRTDRDPRMEFVTPDGQLLTRPEYSDSGYLREVLTRRAQLTASGSSKNVTPVGSPRYANSSPVMAAKKPPPPPAGQPGVRPPPPPPPKAPPGVPPEKRLRHD
jgi:hypothetical protein